MSVSYRHLGPVNNMVEWVLNDVQANRAQVNESTLHTEEEEEEEEEGEEEEEEGGGEEKEEETGVSQ